MKKALIAALALVSLDAAAQLDSGYYLGAAVGQMDYDEGNVLFAIDDKTDTYRLYGGFRFDEMWSMEAYWGQTGDMFSSYVFDVPGVGTATADIGASWRVLQARGLVHLKGFILGIGYWDGEADVDLRLVDVDDSVFTTSGDASDKGYSLIVGGEWAFDDWVIRGEYEYFDSEVGADAAIFSLGGHFKF